MTSPLCRSVAQGNLVGAGATPACRALGRPADPRSGLPWKTHARRVEVLYSTALRRFAPLTRCDAVTCHRKDSGEGEKPGGYASFDRCG
jgi:hypothetical protein